MNYILFMKHLLRIGFLALASFTLLYGTSQAADLNALRVVSSENINKDCMQPDGYDPVWGCFTNVYTSQGTGAAMKVVPTIFMRKNIPTQLVAYTFLQNVGQYLLSSYSDQELAKVFNPVPGIKESGGIRRTAASAFVMWFYGGHVGAEQAELFAHVLTH